MPTRLSALADSVGASETGLRLLITLLVSPFFALVYRFFVQDRLAVRSKPVVHHLFFTSSGLFICWFCYGWHTLYVVATVVCVSLVLRVLELLKRHDLAPPIIFISAMGVLLSGYLMYETADYDVNWTTVQCVLTLKMIAVAFDWSDGNRDASMLSDNQKQVCFSERPTLFELLGYSFYFAGVQVGPFFQFKRYKQFTEGYLFAGPIPSSIIAAGIQFFKGILFLALNVLLGLYVSDVYLYGDDLESYPFVVRLFVNMLWVQKPFARYAGIWLITESSCILSGMGFNGVDRETGEHLWDGMRNVRPVEMQTSLTLHSMIPTFNVATNGWLLRYIYKRLRFLNSKFVSTFAALVFLAMWHGFHAGYYLGFLLIELPVLVTEREIIDLFQPYFPPWEKMSLLTRVVFTCFGQCWKWTVAMFGMVGVSLFSADLVIRSWAKAYFIVPIACLAWFSSRSIVKAILKSRSPRKQLKKDS